MSNSCQEFVIQTIHTGGGGGPTVFATEALLQASAGTEGALAFAQDTQSLWVYCAVGWSQMFVCPPGVLDLVGQDLLSSIAPAQVYSARIPSGLPAIWYACGATPGDLVTNLHYLAAYNLATQDTANRFAAGPAGNSDGGTVTHVLNGADAGARLVSAGVGSTAEVEILDLTDVGTTQKANARLNITSAEGCASHELRHDGSVAGPNSGTTNAIEYYHDDLNTVPAFSVAPTASVNTAVSKFLSGISYLDAGSTIDIAGTATGAFEKAYHPTQVGLITGPGISPLTVNPGAVPAFNDPFVIAETITIGSGAGAVSGAQWDVTIQKPDGSSAVGMTPALAAGICAVADSSTTTFDSFTDENERLTAALAAWDSTIALVDGEAQVFCGSLGYPSATDYPGFVLPAEYLRRIVKATANNGTIAFAGLSDVTVGGDISPYLTGDLNVLLHLETDDEWFDLGREFGDNNGDGSGDSRANSRGALNAGGTSGSTAAWTFGPDNTAFNNNRYEIYIIFNNNTHTLTSITGA